MCLVATQINDDFRSFVLRQRHIVVFHLHHVRLVGVLYLNRLLHNYSHP